MKRFITVILVMSLITAFLSACSSGSNSGKNINDGAYTPDQADYELIDVEKFDRTWDLDSDELGVFYLDLTTHDPSTSMKTKFMEEWAELIRRATNGGVNISISVGATLASPADALSAAEIGTVDLAWIIGANFADVVPSMGMFGLPGLGFGENTKDTDIIWDMYDKYPEMAQQFADNNVKLIHLYTSGGVTISGEKITTLEDFKGKNIRAAGGYASDILAKLGASPISMGPGDMYDALSKGVLDDYCIEWSGIKTYRTYEVSNYYNNSALWVTVMGLVMNQDAYNRLPEEYREVIDYYSGREMSLQMAYQWQTENEQCRESLSTEDQNVEFSSEDYEEIMDICRSYSEEKAEELKTDDFDAPAFLQDIYDDVTAHEGYTYYRLEDK